MAKPSRNISNKSGVIAGWKKQPIFPCSLSKHSFYQEIQGWIFLTPFVTEQSCWCFELRMRKKDLIFEHKHLFPRFVCCIFPGNNRIIRLCTSVMLSATPIPPPPLYYCPHPAKAFPIHSQQHSLSNCGGQRGRPDIQTGKSAETIPIK